MNEGMPLQEEITALQTLVDTAIEFCVSYGFQVIGALIVLILGFLVGSWVANLLMAVCKKKDFDITLSKFLTGIVKLMIVAFAVIIAMGKFGITIAPFIAVLGAAAFGISFAFQGPLANFGAGIAIILTRPFVVGNTVTLAGVSGVVEEVKLGMTRLKDEEGVVITIPNKHIVGEIIENSYENKIANGVIGISYDSDAEKAIEIIRGVLGQFDDVNKKEPVKVGILEFADSSVNIGFRYWVPTVKYLKLVHEINLAIYKAIKEGGIVIPFPQREVNIIAQPSN